MPDINVNLDPDVARFVEAQGPSFIQDLIKSAMAGGACPVCGIGVIVNGGCTNPDCVDYPF